MTTPRGQAKQNVARAVNNADRIVDRLMYLAELYHDYPEYVECVKVACVTAETLKQFIQDHLTTVP